jgi:hypothetical protein
MRLHQLNVGFDAEHDRLLLRISTSAGAEFRLWLTRRYVKLLWPALLELTAGAAPAATPAPVQSNPQARQAVRDFAHQEAVARADFSKPYEANEPSTPLGADPILLSRLEVGRDAAGKPLLSMHPREGQGVTLTLEPVLLHSLLRLIHAAVAHEQWELALALPDPATAPGPDTVVN